MWTATILVSKARTEGIPLAVDVDSTSGHIYWEKQAFIEALEQWLESLEALL